LAPGATLNAQNAIGAINRVLSAGGNVPAGFLNLAGLSGNAFNTAANQLAGQTQGSFAPVAFRAGDMFLKLLFDPYIAGRSSLPGNGAAPLGLCG
jgi:hypothetical protein